MKLEYSNEHHLTQSGECVSVKLHEKYEETSNKIFFAIFGNIFVDADSCQVEENLQAWSRRCYFTTV
jgi:hypothetical protein